MCDRSGEDRGRGGVSSSAPGHRWRVDQQQRRRRRDAPIWSVATQKKDKKINFKGIVRSHKFSIPPFAVVFGLFVWPIGLC